MADEYDPLSLFLQDAPGVTPIPRVNTSPDRRPWLQRTGDRAVQRIVETAKAEAARKRDPLSALIDALGILPGGQSVALAADMAAQGKHPWKRDVGREIDQFAEGVGEAIRNPADALEVAASEAPADWLGVGMRGHTRGEKPVGDLLMQLGAALGIANATPKPRPRIDVPKAPPPTTVSKPDFYLDSPREMAARRVRRGTFFGSRPDPLPETPGPWFHGGPDGLDTLKPGRATTDQGAMGAGNYLTNSEDVARFYAGDGRVYAAHPQPKRILELSGDKRAAIEDAAAELGVKSRPVWDGFRQASPEFAAEFRDAARAAGYDSALWRKSADRAELVVFDDVPVTPRPRTGDPGGVTDAMIAGAPDSMVDEARAAAARAIAAGAGDDLAFVGAGAEGIVFRSGDRAFKVPRGGKSLDVEADALRALDGNGAPRLHDYSEGVIVRDMVDGRTGGWGDEGRLRSAYDRLSEALSEKGISRPEFKGDSFAITPDGPKMYDLGFTHRTGRAAVDDLFRRVDAAAAGSDILDEILELQQLTATGALKPHEARALVRRLEALNPSMAGSLRRDVGFTLSRP